jgi:hypothetical protein
MKLTKINNLMKVHSLYNIINNDFLIFLNTNRKLTIYEWNNIRFIFKQDSLKFTFINTFISREGFKLFSNNEIKNNNISISQFYIVSFPNYNLFLNFIEKIISKNYFFLIYIF